MTRTLSSRIFPCLCALAPLAFVCQGADAAKPQDPFREIRAAFKQAYADVDTGMAQSRRPDSEDLRTYPLYPYLQAARIRRALAETGDDLGSVDQRAQTFVTYYEKEPVGRELRRVWLASLAERRQWAAFLDQYRDDIADEALECQSLEAQIEQGRMEGLAPRIARQWLTPRSLPDCERAFAWLREQNGLTPALIEERVRLALKDGNSSFAREIVVSLPPDRAAPLLLWAALLDDPQRQIDMLIAAPDRLVEDEALLAGWTKLARTNRDAAVQRYDTFVRARKFDATGASRYALALALSLAWNRDAQTLRYFQRVAAADLDDYALEWQARAALWDGDWQLLSKSIAAMSDAQRRVTRWRYWAGRAAERGSDEQLARQLYESTLVDDNFYSMLAAARLGQPLAPHPEKLIADDQELKQIEQLPALLRARELYWCELRELANIEWLYGYETLPQSGRQQSIHLASRWRWHERAIATAAQLRVFNDYALLYPQPFDREVIAASKLTGLPTALIYSVMRQESLYRTDAVSSAGARGLLQVRPETARHTARDWKQPKPKPDELFEPGVGIRLGAAQLRTLIDRFGGQTIVALAGYNAGPNAASRWVPGEPMEADVWIENIPYNETRGYVQRILWHNLVFAWLRSGEPQKTDAWLARIEPLGARSIAGAR